MPEKRNEQKLTNSLFLQKRDLKKIIKNSIPAARNKLQSWKLESEGRKIFQKTCRRRTFDSSIFGFLRAELIFFVQIFLENDKIQKIKIQPLISFRKHLSASTCQFSLL